MLLLSNAVHSQCGLACHRKCLADLAIKCGSKRLARKMNTFGVDFHKHLKATKRYIPIIVTECIAELDLRGLDTRGLYRVSSAKTKLEHLCQLFETGGDRVDLSGRPAHLIGSCLKLYFRQVRPTGLVATTVHSQEFDNCVYTCKWLTLKPVIHRGTEGGREGGTEGGMD